MAANLTAEELQIATEYLRAVTGLAAHMPEISRDAVAVSALVRETLAANAAETADAQPDPGPPWPAKWFSPERAGVTGPPGSGPFRPAGS